MLDFSQQLLNSPNFLYQVSLGKVNGFSYVNKFGLNTDIDQTREDVWEQGGTYTYPSSAATCYISSSHSGDDQIFVVEGLDANWDRQSVTVSLAGQTKTEIGTGKTWIRIFRAYNNGITNLAGAVYVYEDDTVTAGVPQTAGKIKAVVSKSDLGYQQTNMALYTIPNNFYGLLFRWHVALLKTVSGVFGEPWLQTRDFGKIFRVREEEFISDTADMEQREFKIPILLSPKTDIKITCNSSANDAKCSATFDMLLISAAEYAKL